MIYVELTTGERAKAEVKIYSKNKNKLETWKRKVNITDQRSCYTLLLCIIENIYLTSE